MNIGLAFVIVILIICIFFGFLYKQGEGLLDWHNLIPNFNSQYSTMYTKFVDGKPIIFLPEQFIGVWVADELIPTTINKEEKENIMNLLSKSYNVFLSLSNINLNNKNIFEYCKYINEHKYPICFISNKFPPEEVLYDISFNNGKYWMVVYDYKKYVKEN